MCIRDSFDDCILSQQRGYGLDNEEAEMGVGCIGVLIYDRSGQVAAGLSISAPVERRQASWIDAITKAGKDISHDLGFTSA